MKLTSGAKFATLALGLVALASPSWATLEISIGAQTCVDNAACDTNSAAGVINTSAAFNTAAGAGIGTISVNGTTSTSTTPALLTFSMNGTASSLGSFVIKVTDTFTSPVAPVVLTVNDTGLGAPGGAAGTLSAQGFFGATGTLFDTTGTSTGIATTALSSSSASSSSGKTSTGSPYSLTDVITVNITTLGTGAFQIDSNLTAASVPEPASLSLLGGALLLAGTALRRKFQA